MFKAKINITTNKKNTTVPENLNRIELFPAATSHRYIFHATRGGNITSDDMFQVAQKTVNDAKIKELEDKMKFRGKMEFYEDEARKVLAK